MKVKPFKDITWDEMMVLYHDLEDRIGYDVRCVSIIGSLDSGKRIYFSLTEKTLSEIRLNFSDYIFNHVIEFRCYPVLRSMESMTEEELEEYRGTLVELPNEEYLISTPRTKDWLKSKNFDYNGLIKIGLAGEE